MGRLNPTPRPRAGWTSRAIIWLAVAIAILWATGLLLHNGEAGAEGAMADLSEAQMRWRHSASVLHGVFAWVLCVVAGRWVWPHIALIWARRPRHWVWIAGLLVAACGGLAALTGLGLLYGAADWRGQLSALHWASGLIWPALCIAHGWRWSARRARRQQPAESNVQPAPARAESGSPNTRSNTHANTKV